MCILLVGNITMNVVHNVEIDKRLSCLEQQKEKPVTAMVTTTMYNAVESQCDADPLVTAANYKIIPAKASNQKYVALSRNLLKRWNGKFNYGDKIRITGTKHKDGIYTVADSMNKRYINHVDILETSGVDWYKYDNVQITRIS